MTASHVAAIITCRDQGRTVEDALRSVLDQTWPPSDVVIVDAGCTDIYTLQALARLHESGHPVLRTACENVAAARNLGIRSTAAPYIVVLEADIALGPTYLAEATDYLNQHSTLAFVTCEIESAARVGHPIKPPELIDTVAREESPSLVNVSPRRLGCRRWL